MTALEEQQTRTPPPRWLGPLAVLLVCAGCTLSVAPFLRLFEFSNGGENMVVASAQEIRRGELRGRTGLWLVPTLHDEDRTKKPPLATWLSALAARPATVAQLDHADPAARQEAFADFAVQVRWPAFVAMCGVIVATYALGTLLGGVRLGILSAVVCGSSFFWLRNARLATTDAHLALWVSVTNALLAWAVFKRRWWPGLVGGGAALGLAMMSKGPVALLQTVLPVLAFVAWRRRRTPARVRGETEPRRRRPIGPMLTGVLAFAVVGLSWYLLVLWNKPEVWDEWTREITREGATGLPPSRWYNYATLPGFLFPWSMFFVAGLVGATIVAFRKPAGQAGNGGGDARPAQEGRIVLAVLLLLVPVVVMSFFRDREIRYLIPLLAPSSVIAAWGLAELLGGENAAGAGRRRATWLVAGLHWLPLMLATAGLPLAAWPLGELRTVDDAPWYSPRVALAAAEVFVVLVVVAMVLQRRRPVWAVAVGSAAVMLLWGVVFNAGYRNHREGRSEMRPLAEQILAAHPDAEVFSFRPDRPVRHAPIDLSIYLNRVVKNLRDPAELAETTGPRVFTVRQRHKQAVDDPSAFAPRAGGEWRFFAATPVDESMWYAFTSVGPSASTRTAPSAAP